MRAAWHRQSRQGQFMYKRGSYRDTWHPTLRALGVATTCMRRGGRLDVQEHTRNARSRSLV